MAAQRPVALELLQLLQLLLCVSQSAGRGRPGCVSDVV